MTINLPKSPGVYTIRHTSGAEYIGSTNNIARRVKENRGALRAGTHKSPKFQELWNSTSEDEWEFIVLEQCDITTLIIREQHYFDQATNLLNYMRTADHSWKGRKWPKEFGDACSARAKALNESGVFGGNVRSEQARVDHAVLMSKYTAEGRIGTARWSEETKAKAALSNSKRMRTPEAKANQSEKAKDLHAQGRLGAKTWKPGEREARSERMRQMHRDGLMGSKSRQAKAIEKTVSILTDVCS